MGGQGGSRVSYGSLAAIPIDNALVWVRPFYVTSTQTNLPSLRFVIVNFEGTVSIQPTLIEALNEVFVQELPPDEPTDPVEEPGEEPGEEPPPEETLDEQAARLLAEPDDGPARWLAERCHDLAANPPAGWRPVTQLDTK